MSAILSREQLLFYEQNRYVVIRNIVPQDVLELGERIIAKWVDGWVQRGLLKETKKEIDFQHRFKCALE